MIKIGISGKANSGKNTLAKLIKKELNANNNGSKIIFNFHKYNTKLMGKKTNA